MEEVVNIQEDLEDAEENKLSESSFKTLSDPTAIITNHVNGVDSDQELKNINPIIETTSNNVQIKRNTNDSRLSYSNRSSRNKETNQHNLELNILPITHVTLNLSVVNKKTTSSVHWRHNFVRKKTNYSPSNSINFQNASVTRSNSVYSATKQSKEFLSNPSQQSDYSDNTTTPDFTKSKSTIKSRDSSALSYHITDYKNFEHSRHLLTLQQQQNRQSVNFRQQTPLQHQQQQFNRFMDTTNRPLSYIDIVRSKSSTGESCSSVCSVETPGGQRMQRHNYSVAEFNKFKSKLLKNHSRNYYIFDNANMNNRLQRKLNEPLFQFQPVNQQDESQLDTLNKQHLSQIKSIYETIQRANNIKKQSVIEMRRMNYLNSIKNTHEVLSNSLSVTKLN